MKLKSIKYLSVRSFDKSRTPGYHKITAHSYLNATSFHLKHFQRDASKENPLSYLTPNKNNNDSSRKQKHSIRILHYGELPKIKSMNSLYKSKMSFLKDNSHSNLSRQSSKAFLKVNGAKTNRNKTAFLSLYHTGMITKRRDTSERNKERNRNDIKLLVKQGCGFNNSTSLSSTAFAKKMSKRLYSSMSLERKEMVMANEEGRMGESQVKLPNNLLRTFSGKSQTGRSQGRVSKVNQDSFLMMTCINDLPDFNVFGVFDGHGVNGHFSSEFVKNYFKQFILNHEDLSPLKSTEEIYLKLKYSDYLIVKELFTTAESALSQCNFDVTFSGTTAVLLIQIGNHLICANVGDSRALMIEEKGDNSQRHRCIPLSYDQKPHDAREKRRIETAGGRVEQYSRKPYPLISSSLRRWNQSWAFQGVDEDVPLSWPCYESLHWRFNCELNWSYC